MKSRSAKSKTADLFAAGLASPVGKEPRSWRAGGVPPTPQSLSKLLPTKLWYAAVFPQLIEADAPSALLQRLCLRAQAFTSFVSIEAPNALLLEIKGSLKLFGPVEVLHAKIDACWRGINMPAQSATAPSTLAALWFARLGQSVQIEDLSTLAGRLSALPLACTAWSGERLHTLRSMGVRNVGELLRLPRAGLARRLGPDLVQELDIALAKRPAPRRAFVARERFRERCDFESEVETAAYLAKALEPMIEHCAQFLLERQAGIQNLRLKLWHRSVPASYIHFGFASVTGECRRLKDVIAQRLQQLTLSAPVRGMELISGSLQPLSATSLDAFAGRAGAGGDARDTAPQLVERLRARLGEDAVYGVASICEHRPEAAWRRVHELQEQAATQEIKQGMPRPVWLLDQPLPMHSSLTLEHGPERIESGWWDGKGVARDYYVARQTHGAKLWVFQERQSKRWYVHGVFA